MKNPFNIGETVFLNSGSPELTVQGTDEEYVHVEWLQADGSRESDSFPHRCLSYTNRRDLAN